MVDCESVKQGELNKQLHTKSEGSDRMPINSWELQSSTALRMNGNTLAPADARELLSICAQCLKPLGWVYNVMTG